MWATVPAGNTRLFNVNLYNLMQYNATTLRNYNLIKVKYVYFFEVIPW